MWQTLIEAHIWGIGGDLSLFYFIKICQNHTHTPQKRIQIFCCKFPFLLQKLSAFAKLFSLGEGVITFLSTSYFFTYPLQTCHLLRRNLFWVARHYDCITKSTEDRWRCSNFHLRWFNSKIGKVESRN